jgi:hypothetical protein
LIFEARLGDASRWHSYLNYLLMVPIDTMPEWTHDQEIVLNSTWHGPHLLARLWHWRFYLERFKTSQIAADAFTIPPTQEEISWARSVILSRAFTTGPSQGESRWLIPVLDLTQHSHSDPHSKPVLQGPVKQGVALRDVERGESLSYQYGNLDNPVLVSQMGFLMDHNDIGPPRQSEVTLHEVPSIYPQCQDEWKAFGNLNSSVPATVPDIVLECEFLARLESKAHASIAVRIGYHKFLGKDDLPLLEFNASTRYYNVDQTSPDGEDFGVPQADFEQMVNAHSATFKYSLTLCGTQLARMEDPNAKEALDRLAVDNTRWSIMLTTSVKQNKLMLSRCVMSMERRLSGLAVWQEIVSPAQSLTDVTFKPGRLGMTFDEDTGLVKDVSADGLAAKNRVKSGVTILKINGNPFSGSLLVASATGSQDYTMTFKGEMAPKPRILEL